MPLTSEELFRLGFELGEPVPFSALPDDTLFVFPPQLEDTVSWRTNRYWRIKENGYAPFMTPDIYNKEPGGDYVQKYMTDFPVPKDKVDPSKVGVVVVPIKWLRGQ